MFEDFPEILTIEDIMEILMIGKNTAYKILNSGELKSFRIGRNHKVLRSALIDYILYKNNSLV